MKNTTSGLPVACLKTESRIFQIKILKICYPLDRASFI